MVLICGILTIVVTTLIAALNEINYFRYCSNATALDPISGLPLEVTEEWVNKDGETVTINLVNFHPRGPCVQWFGDSYVSSPPYSYGPPQDNCSAAYDPLLCPLDSTFLSHLFPVPCSLFSPLTFPFSTSSTVQPPQLGWIPDFMADPALLGIVFSQLLTYQTNFWTLVASVSGVDMGERQRGEPIPLFASFPPTPYTPPVSRGFLGNFTPEFYSDGSTEDLLEGTINFEERPYFVPVSFFFFFFFPRFPSILI